MISGRGPPVVAAGLRAAACMIAPAEALWHDMQPRHHCRAIPCPSIAAKSFYPPPP